MGNIRQAQAGRTSSNRVLQQQRRRTRTRRVPRQISKAWRPAAVGIPNLLPNAHRGRDARRSGKRGAVAGTGRSSRAIADALYEGAHEEMLDLIDAKPAVSPRMVARSV